MLVVGSLLVASAAPAQVLNAKLSGPMVSGGDVSFFRISPDGQWVVYSADQEIDGSIQLYSVSIDGGTPERLNGLLPSNQSAGLFYISPDSRFVVYTAPQDTPNYLELYSVPIEGPASAGVKLNTPVSTDGYVFAELISPDSQWVVYFKVPSAGAKPEIYSVPIEGPFSESVRLNGPIQGEGNSFSFAISPDSSRFVYRADEDTSGTHELFSVPIRGPADDGVTLNPPLVAGGDVNSPPYVTPDSSRVVYEADQRFDEATELFSVPIDGPATAGVRLNPALVSNGAVQIVKMSPDGSRVVYTADQQIDEQVELFSVPVTGPPNAAVKLNGPLTAGGDVGFLFKISEDSSRVVYSADQDTDEVMELYSVPIDGPTGAEEKISGPMATGGNVTTSFEISPDGRRVVYRADQEEDTRFELYSVPIDGPAGAGVKLNKSVGFFGDVTTFFTISPDSRRVLYRYNRNTFPLSTPFTVQSVPIEGPSAAGYTINGPLVEDGDVDEFYFRFTPDGSRVVYIADQDTDEVFELYVSNAASLARMWEAYE